MDRKQEVKLQTLHLVAAAWSWWNSDSLAHHFSKAVFYVTILNSNVDDIQIDERKLEENLTESHSHTYTLC